METFSVVFGVFSFCLRLFRCAVVGVIVISDCASSSALSLPGGRLLFTSTAAAHAISSSFKESSLDP